jgi:hypothetical protein
MSIGGWDQLQREIGTWQDQTFGSGAMVPIDWPIKHLAEEVGELLSEPHDAAEYADCLILLLCAARIAGYGADDLLRACWAKHAINRERAWAETDELGVFHHK